MKSILKIFRDDIRLLSRRFFASAVIVAISVLPALYAWVNIYANGDPYANTGEIKIALASYDKGIDLEDGSHVNMAEEVFEEMKGSDKIGWQFPGTPTDAIEGVRSGEYYAAVIFEDNFTYNMYNFEQALIDDKAPLIYYENQKANAIAPKITQTAAQTLQETIKTKYLQNVFGQIFNETNDIADDLSDSDTADSIIARLRHIKGTLDAYDSAISSFTGNSGKIHSDLSKADGKLTRAGKSARKSAANAGSDLTNARNSLEVLSKVLKNREKSIEEKRTALEKTVGKLTQGGLSDAEKQALREEMVKQATALKSDLEGLLAMFPDTEGTPAIKAIRAVLTSMISDIDTLLNASLSPEEASAVMEELKTLSQVSLSASVDSLIGSIDRTLDLMKPLMESTSAMLKDISPVLKGADDTVYELDNALLQMQTMFRATSDRIDDIISKVEAASEDDKLALLVTLLGGDPDKYAEFFSSLVDVEIIDLYSVASYGAAMAPFYSVLAIWVGGVILVAILKTHIDRKKYPNATETQAFFGRFILFFVLGQIQAGVIVAGDIFLLGCDPVHPWLMWLTAAVTSLIFNLLIYALTLSFGDVGKAIVVILMVLQIAGSSGSYPIEILPPVFGKVYKFFPFPYAINAMREALCGLHELDMYRYLAELAVFGIIGLLIGLLVRKPFIGINRFVSEKLEETELL